jgi:hypothetical protein
MALVQVRPVPQRFHSGRLIVDLLDAEFQINRVPMLVTVYAGPATIKW